MDKKLEYVRPTARSVHRGFAVTPGRMLRPWLRRRKQTEPAAPSVAAASAAAAAVARRHPIPTYPGDSTFDVDQQWRLVANIRTIH